MIIDFCKWPTVESKHFQSIYSVYGNKISIASRKGAFNPCVIDFVL